MKKLLKKSEGNKYDSGKVRFSLFPLDVLKEIVGVMEYGANKYSRDNWKKVIPTSRYYDALLRHIFAWKQGEKRDTETGLLHLSHAACNLVFLIYFELRRK